MIILKLILFSSSFNYDMFDFMSDYFSYSYLSTWYDNELTPNYAMIDGYKCNLNFFIPSTSFDHGKNKSDKLPRKYNKFC
jgi:hypothetical protein